MSARHISITDLRASWKAARLKNMTQRIRNGIWGDDPHEDGSDVLCVRAADFDRQRLRVKVDNLPVRHIDVNALKAHRLTPGDLILEKSGGGEKQPVGAAVLFDLDVVAVCSNFCARLRPADDIEPRFLNYSLAAAYYLGISERAIKQTTGIQNLDTDEFLATRWSYPGIDEQRKIADFLDAETGRIDDAVNRQRAASSLLTERETALLDDITERLGTEFGTAPLRRFLVRIEQGVSPQCDNVPAKFDEWGVLKVSAVKDGKFHPNENKRLPDERLLVRRYEIRDRDLLVTRANTPALVGATAVAHDPPSRLLLCDKIFRLQLDGRLDEDFFTLVARATRIRSLCAEAAHGTSQSMANLRAEEVKSWPVPLAPLSTQVDELREFRKSAESIRQLRQLIGSHLTVLAERRQALITAAVTGQFDVTVGRGANLS